MLLFYTCTHKYISQKKKWYTIKKNKNFYQTIFKSEKKVSLLSN